MVMVMQPVVVMSSGDDEMVMLAALATAVVGEEEEAVVSVMDELVIRFSRDFPFRIGSQRSAACTGLQKSLCSSMLSPPRTCK